MVIEFFKREILPRRYFILIGAAGVAIGALAVAFIVQMGLKSVGAGVFCARDMLCIKTGYVRIADPHQIQLNLVADEPLRLGVSWASNAQMTNPVLQYRAVGSSDWTNSQPQRKTAPSNGVLGSDLNLYSAVIEDVEHGAAYEYRIAYDVRTWDRSGQPFTQDRLSETYEFTTPPQNWDTPLTATYISDTGLIGRLDGLSGGTAHIIEHMQSDAPHLLLGGGDYAYATGDGRFPFPSDAISEWFRQWQPVLARSVFVPQWGNHDCCLDETTDLWTPRVNRPASTAPDDLSYSFDIGRAHFVAFFAPAISRHAPSERTLDWLDQDLADARDRGRDWLVVYQHDPLYGSGTSHASNKTLRTALKPILERHSVELHLGGHDQSYERTHPLLEDKILPGEAADPIGATYVDTQGVIYAKVSPAGKKSGRSRDFSRLPETLPEEIAVGNDTLYHYAHLAFGEDGTLVFTAYGVDEDGARKVVDTFTLQKSDF